MSVSQAAVSLSAEQGQVLGLLLPCLSGMAVDRAVISGDLVRIWVHAVAGGAACPDCGTWCRRCMTGTRGGCVMRPRAGAGC